jgi:hypothetical protein
MTAERPGLGFEGLQRTGDDFSIYSIFIADHATWLHDFLTDEDAPALDTRELTEAIRNWCDLEHELDNLPVMLPYAKMLHDNKAHREIDKFFQLRHDFHIALPFSEAERGWLLSLCEKLVDSDDVSYLPHALALYEADIVAAGVRQHVSGRELGHRWHDWRGQTGDYTDQGTLAIARTALGAIADLFNA